jgi:hypothetical protein
MSVGSVTTAPQPQQPVTQTTSAGSGKAQHHHHSGEEQQAAATPATRPAPSEAAVGVNKVV